jgi:hypothetical protein
MQILPFQTAKQSKEVKAHVLIQVMHQILLNCPEWFLGVSCQKTGVKVPSPIKITLDSTPDNRLSY